MTATSPSAWNSVLPGTRTVAFTWRQERLSASAEQIHSLGLELHQRLGLLGGHLTKLGSNLEKAVDSYNSAIGSVETRVLVGRHPDDPGKLKSAPVPEEIIARFGQD